MEAFALFMVFIVGGARLITMFSERKGEIDRRRKAQNRGDEFYVDRYGTAHHVKSDEPYQLFTDYKTGDTYEVNPYTLEKRRNVSLEKRQRIDAEEHKKAIARGRRLYPFEGTGYGNNHATDFIKGTRYKDMKNGEIYVKRKIYGIYFYLNLKTGLFDYYEFPEFRNRNAEISYYDWELNRFCKSKPTPELGEKIKEQLNKKQKQYIADDGLENMSSPIWRNNNYCRF